MSPQKPFTLKSLPHDTQCIIEALLHSPLGLQCQREAREEFAKRHPGQPLAPEHLDVLSLQRFASAVQGVDAGVEKFIAGLTG